MFYLGLRKKATAAEKSEIWLSGLERVNDSSIMVNMVTTKRQSLATNNVTT